MRASTSDGSVDSRICHSEFHAPPSQKPSHCPHLFMTCPLAHMWATRRVPSAPPSNLRVLLARSLVCLLACLFWLGERSQRLPTLCCRHSTVTHRSLVPSSRFQRQPFPSIQSSDNLANLSSNQCVAHSATGVLTILFALLRLQSKPLQRFAIGCARHYRHQAVATQSDAYCVLLLQPSYLLFMLPIE